MKTLKKFWKYFINFIVLFLLVTGLMYLVTRTEIINTGKDIECIVKEESPVIEITECNNKKITGTVTNDTKVLINVIYVKAEFYDDNNNLLGTKDSEIKYFNVGEKSKFEIENEYKNVSKIELSVSSEKEG